MAHVEYLKSAMAKYSHPELAKGDVMAVLSAFTDLRPQLSEYVFNNGSAKELLCIEGTIPVFYKGKIYNIPVCLWLLDTHPYKSPMVFVKPTSGMQVKPGRHVDSNGRIYLPYLHDWKHPGSDLSSLVQILACLFGEEPPVFSKPQTTAAATTTTITTTTAIVSPAANQSLVPFAAPTSSPGIYTPYVAINGPVCITPASPFLSSPSADPPRRICAICCTASCDPVALVPCGHARFCRSCCIKLPQKNIQCPLCNENVFNILNLHF